jgi:hypothetical protein
MLANHSQPPSRLFSIDLLKAISIVAVVSFHSFVPESADLAATQRLETLFSPLRFCVPVFLTVYFFLLQRGLEKHAGEAPSLALKKRFSRLLIPTLFWFALATIVFIILFPSQSTPAQLAVTILQGKIFHGAYYLLVLLQLLPLFVGLHCWFVKGQNILITLLLQGFVFLLTYAVLFNTFGDQVILVLRRVSRPLFIDYFVYMALGAFFYRHWSTFTKVSNRIASPFKILLLVLTGVMMTVEYLYLHSATGEKFAPFEYVMVSCGLSVLIAFLCFSSVREEQLTPVVRRSVQLLSTYSLGIFCINGILSPVLSQIGSFWAGEATFGFHEILMIKIVGWGLLLAASLVGSIALDKVGLRACVR